MRNGRLSHELGTRAVSMLANTKHFIFYLLLDIFCQIFLYHFAHLYHRHSHR